MFSSWTPTVWINLGSPYKLTLDNRQYSIPRDKDILVLRNSIVSRNILASDKLFTIKFFPGALDSIFGIHQLHFIGKLASATDIIPATLIRKIKEETGLHEKVKTIEEFLLLNLSKQKRRDHYTQIMRDSTDMYVLSGMHYNTSEIASKLFTTSRSINRYFHITVGISPKKYFSIIRARAALTSYVMEKNGFDPACYGYYDMSHFYKEAMKFTGRRMGSVKKCPFYT
jgi:AraC-like DNA-binding protein